MSLHSRTIAGVVFILIGLLFAAAGGRNLPSHRFDLTKIKPFHGPILALEFVDTPLRASEILSQMKNEEIAQMTKDDQFKVIPFYTVVLCVAILLVFSWAQLGVPARVRIGAALLIACLVLAAAANDVRENNGIFDFLAATKGKPAETVKDMTVLQPTLDRIRSASLLKWGLLFVVLLSMSAPLFAHGGRRAFVVGALFALTGVAGLISLLPPARLLVEWAFVMMGLSLAALGAWFISLQAAAQTDRNGSR